MGFFDKPFNAAEVEPQGAFEPLPEGDYIVIVTSARPRATKKGGEMLELSYKVDEGKHKGRNLYEYLNLVNGNGERLVVGERKLSALCHACGVVPLRQPAQLVGHRIVLKVGVKERDDKPGVFSNEVKGVILPKKQDDPIASAPTTDTETDEAPAWG